MVVTQPNQSDQQDSGDPPEPQSSPLPSPTAKSEIWSNSGATSAPRLSAIAVIVSLLALVVSAAGFYFSYLKVEDDLQMRVIDIDPRPPDSNLAKYPYYSQGILFARTAFVNAGNRPALVVRVDWRAGPTGEHWRFGNDAYTSGKQLPFVIEPHEIRLIDLGIPAGDVVRDFQFGAPVTDTDDPGPVFELSCSLNVTSLDSHGVSHEKETAPVIMVRVTKTRLVRSVALNNGAVTHLFK